MPRLDLNPGRDSVSTMFGVTDARAEIHPIIVYGLADVPLPLRANIRPDSPLYRCCFYSAIVGPTGAAGLTKAFELLTEPPCDEVAEGMRIARAIAGALQKTTVGILLFGVLSREEATACRLGFHAGEAAPFRRALQAAGLTLVEGAEVFQDRLRFLVSDAALVTRATDGDTLSLTEAHVVLRPEAEGAPWLSAIMSPPTSWQCSVIGMDGGVVDLRSTGSDDTQPIRFPAGALRVPTDGLPETDGLAELSPHRARASAVTSRAAQRVRYCSGAWPSTRSRARTTRSSPRRTAGLVTWSPST